MLTPKQAAKSISLWLYSDSDLVVEPALIQGYLEADVKANGGRCMTEEECETFVCGEAGSVEFEALQRAFPETQTLLDLYF